MTKTVYAAPNISPSVWTPPRGVVVLPLSEHPAIVWESRRERLPPGERRSHGTPALALMQYLRTHPPADVQTIGAALGMRWQAAKTTLIANPHLFQRVGTVATNKGKRRTLWALVD